MLDYEDIDFKALGKLTKKYRNKSDVRVKGDAAQQQIGLVAEDVLTVSPGLVRDCVIQERDPHTGEEIDVDLVVTELGDLVDVGEHGAHRGRGHLLRC